MESKQTVNKDDDISSEKFEKKDRKYNKESVQIDKVSFCADVQ